MEQPTPEPIVKTALGFMAAKFLFVAEEIGLFEALADAPGNLEQVAQRISVPARTARMVADAMVSLGLLEKQDGIYRNGASAAAFLSGRPDTGLRPALRFFNRISYRHWIELEDAIRAGRRPSKWGQMSEAEQQIVSEGIAAHTAGAAAAVADAYDFGRHRHLLDVGGGTGSFLVAILRHHPALAGTLFELPETAAVARRMLANKPEAARITIAEGDIFKGSPPQGADAVLIANVVHIFLPDRNRELFRRVRSHVANGARLLLLDIWTDPGHTSPQPAPLMAGEFLLFAGEGDVYSAEEVQVWLRETGWQPVEQVSVLGANSMIVAEAV